MQKSFRPALVAVAVMWLGTSDSSASLKEIAKGVFVDDFEDARLDQLAVDPKGKDQKARLPQALEIAREGSETVLHLKGGASHTSVLYPDRTFQDFSLSVRVKKTPGGLAGIVVRDHWRVYFQMRGYLSISSDLPEMEGKGELYKSGTTFTGYHDLKVVCAGPLLHVLVDGKQIVTQRIPAGEGKVGFYASGGGEAYYDKLRIDPQVAPSDYLQFEPRATDDSLVFAPTGKVVLRVGARNHSAAPQTATVAAAVKKWSGETVGREVRKEANLEAGADRTLELDLGHIPAGFYRGQLRASVGGKQVCLIDDLPIAIQERERGEFKVPTIPVAAYYKYFSPKTPLYHNTYAHASARSLKDHHFNTIVADLTFTPETIAIFQSYGIATISRMAQFIDHPAVIGTLVKDEPKPGADVEELKQLYQDLRAKTNKPVTTCLVGEGIGLGEPSDPVRLWQQLDAGVRCFRWYGIKKYAYDALFPVQYKGWLPLASVFRIVESSSPTPWWFVAPALGKTDHEAYYQRPTPAQTGVVMHLALAYGVDGFLFFAFQTFQGLPCFVDQQSLEPTDGCYAAAAKIAAQIAVHADLLQALRLGGLDVRCLSPVVEVRPLEDRRKGKSNDFSQRQYVYVINKDSRNPASTQLLLWADRWGITHVEDIYSGRKLAIKERDEGGYVSIPLTLSPGEGQLLAIDVQDKLAAPAPKKK